MTALACQATQSSTASARLKSAAELAGRILLASVFFYSAIAKANNYGQVMAYMSSHGVPGSLLPLVLATEVLFPIALILGWTMRIAAFLLLGYSVLAASIFHHNFGDPAEALAFFKDLGLTAALLLLIVHGAGPLSLDDRPLQEAAVGACVGGADYPNVKSNTAAPGPRNSISST